MQIERGKLEGIAIITPQVLEDNRGSFSELFRRDFFREHSLEAIFVQQNVSLSMKSVVRGLHFQWDPPLAKLIRVSWGLIFAVAVDIRKKSPALGKWMGIELSAEERKEMYVPPGFASGFCSLSDPAQVEYLYTAPYNPKGESSIIWNDPEIGIRWPVKNPVLSPRDASGQTFQEWLKRPESDCF